MKPKSSFFSLLLLGMVASFFLFTPRAWALYSDNFITTGNWDEAENWSSGDLPWENATGDISVDLTVQAASVMTIDSKSVWTGAQFGANEGKTFVVRRVTVSGGKTLRVESGGYLEFYGDTRILSNSTGSTIVVDGGTIKSTMNSNNLGGIVLGGAHGGLVVSGHAVIDISDARPAYNSGIDFANSNVNSKPFHVIGSDASISLENIRFLETGSNNPKFRFTLDGGGASAIAVTNALNLAAANNTISLQLYLEEGWVSAPDTVVLFDLANGSTGTFDEVVTSRGSFSGAEGTIIEIASESDPSAYLSYQLTYALNGTDIALLSIPEPSVVALIGLGIVAVFLGRAVKV